MGPRGWDAKPVTGARQPLDSSPEGGRVIAGLIKPLTCSGPVATQLLRDGAQWLAPRFLVPSGNAETQTELEARMRKGESNPHGCHPTGS